MRLAAVLVLGAIGLAAGLAIAGLPPGATLAALGAGVIFYLVFLRPVAAIAVLLAVIPFNILWIGTGITLPEITYAAIYILLGISWILKKMTRVFLKSGSRSFSSFVTAPLAAFFCAAIVACIIGILQGHRFPKWSSDVNAIMYYGLCFIMLEFVKDKKTLYNLFFVAVVASVLGLIKGFFSLQASGASGEIKIAAAELTRVRAAGIVGLIMLIISVSLAVNLLRGRKRNLFIALAFFFGMAQIISFARALWLAAVFGLAFLFFILSAKQKLNFLRLTAAVALLLSLYISIAMSLPSHNPLSRLLYSVETRYFSIFTAKKEPGVLARDAEIKEALRQAGKHPFLGNGLGTEIHYFRYDNWYGAPVWDTTRYIHNAYVYLFLNMGILGLITFLWFCVSLIIYGLRLYNAPGDETDKAVALGVTCAFVSLMVASLAGPLLTGPIATMYFGFFLGALFVIDRSRKEAP